MILAPPRRVKPRRVGTLRGWSTFAVATLLLLLAGGRLDSPLVQASADPEPAPADAPLVNPIVSLRPPMRLPNVVAQTNALRKPLTSLHPLHSTERHPSVVALALPAGPKRVDLSQRATELAQAPAPRMTDLRVPSTAKSGDFISVSFGAVARQVKIVASIGPTIISKTIVGAQHGSIAIRSPKSDLDSRIMTVRAYAQNGNRTSTLQAMVVLVRP